MKLRASQVAPVVKNPAASAGDTRDTGSIPGSDRSPGEGHGNLSILPWRIPWTEEPVSPWGHKELDTTEHTHIQGTISESDSVDSFVS